MRTIEDLEHFVLAEGETLILRSRRHMSESEIAHARFLLDRFLPDRPVLLLPPEMDVMAGRIEVFGVDPGKGDDGPTQEDIDAERVEIETAYVSGKTVYASEGDDEFFVHRSLNPHTFDWNKYRYSLTKPK